MSVFGKAVYYSYPLLELSCKDSLINARLAQYKPRLRRCGVRALRKLERGWRGAGSGQLYAVHLPL